MHTQSSDSYAKHSNLTVLFGNDTGHNVIYSVGGCVEIEIPKLEMENHLREKRQAHALSQKQLADLAGITRQAISALESNQYSPATSVALQLARALQCRVEDLFSIKRGGEIIEGELLGALPQSNGPVRAQVTQIGHRVLVRPLIGIGELSSLSANADGLIIGTNPDKNRVKVRLLKDREAVRRKIRGWRLRPGDVFGRRACAKTRSGKRGAVSDGQQHRPCGAQARRSSRGGHSFGRREIKGLGTSQFEAQPRRHGLHRRHFRPLGRRLHCPPGQPQEGARRSAILQNPASESSTAKEVQARAVFSTNN